MLFAALILSLMALPLLACSGKEASSASPSPEASAVVETPGPTQAPLPIEVTQEPVRWIATPVLDLASATDLSQPFDEVLRQNGRPPATPPTWRLQLVEGNGAPVEILNTPRMLTDFVWQTARGLSIDFETVRSLEAPGLGVATAFRWRGELEYDLDSRTWSEQLDELPGDFAFDPRPGNFTLPRLSLQLDRARRQALITIGVGRPPPMPYQLTDVFIVGADGRQRRLEGESDLRNVVWVPSGTALVGTRGGGLVGQPYELLIIPVEGGEAVVIRNTTRFIVQQGPTSLDGRIAFLARGSSESYLGTYDSATRRVRVIASVPETMMMIWPPGSERLLVGDRIFDLTTGISQPGSPSDLYPNAQQQPQETASPSGRLVATLAEPQQVPRDACPGYPHRLTITNKQTGASKTLLECPAGTSGFLQWVSESKLAGAFASCWSCDAPDSRIWLFDVERETAQSLTDGLEDYASVSPSPDKTKLLVSGERLRLYSIDGALLRDYGPRPEGLLFAQTSWSPDGSSFAYILRPASWPVGP